MENIKSSLSQQLANVEGLLAICISDKEGVPVVKVANHEAPEVCMRPNFLSLSNLAHDQASKLNYGRNTGGVVFFESYQVVYYIQQPLIVTFIAKSDSNTGLIKSSVADIQPVLTNLIDVVATQDTNQ